MPIKEAIVNTAIPKEVEKPIPVRVITTRPPRVASENENLDQGSTVGSSPKVEETSPAAESVKLSPQLSALARKEQAFRQREQALKEREKSLEAKLADAERFSTLQSKLSAKDYSEAEALGLSYDGYTEYLLNKQSGEKPDDAVTKLASEVEALKKSREDSANQEYEETVAEYRKEIKTLVGSNPEFSTVKELEREDAVLQLILDSWEEDGEELTVEDASKQIEDFLVSEAMKMAGVTKVKSKFGETERKLPPPKPGLKTLTQQVTTGAAETRPKSLQHMSDSDRYAEARRRMLAKKQAQQGL